MNAFQVSYNLNHRRQVLLFSGDLLILFFFSHENLSIKNIIAVWWNIEVIV